MSAAWSYDGSLGGLFALLAAALEGEVLPVSVHSLGGAHRRPVSVRWDGERFVPAASPGAAGSMRAGAPELFDFRAEGLPAAYAASSDPGASGSPHPGSGGPSFDRGAADAARRALEGASRAGLADFLRAWASEKPVEPEALAFAVGIVSEARKGGRGGAGAAAVESRRLDRGDDATRRVLVVSDTVSREFHRLSGTLRFCPARGGRWVAPVESFAYLLNALGGHFRIRFGCERWALVDVRRHLAVVPHEELFPADGAGRKESRLSVMDAEDAVSGGLLSPADLSRALGPLPAAEGLDPWEELWRDYHRWTAVETRRNPGLQRKFLPLRLWKNLPELYDTEDRGATRR